MTPLTHATVGSLICKTAQKPGGRRLSWLLAVPLALASHYVLDAIPHFEGIVSVPGFKFSNLLALALGLIGGAFSFYLLRRDRDYGIVCAILFAWIGIGSYTLSPLRLVTALAGMAVVSWKTGRSGCVGIFVSGIAGILPDLVPGNFEWLTNVHNYFHYKIDLGALWYAGVNGWPVPDSFAERLHDSYALAGFALELMIEGTIFLASLYLLTQTENDVAPVTKTVAEPGTVRWEMPSETQELAEGIAESR